MATDVLAVTALLASEPGVPVVVFDSNAALRMAIVDRQSVHALDDDWDVAGVYLLLDPVTLDGAWSVYVGKAPAGMRHRLKDHIRKKDHWARALLITRDTTHGWHSAQVGWLEGRLYDLLDGASLATLSNVQQPGDETLPPFERTALEAMVEPIAAVLRLLGCSPDAFDDVEDPATDDGSSTDPKKHYGVSLADLLDAGRLHAGEQLTSTRPSWSATAHLQADGAVVVDGVAHSSPSGAGRAVRDGRATNGWSFWAVERDGSSVPLATIRARHLRRRDA